MGRKRTLAITLAAILCSVAAGSLIAQDRAPQRTAPPRMELPPPGARERITSPTAGGGFPVGGGEFRGGHPGEFHGPPFRRPVDEIDHLRELEEVARELENEQKPQLAARVRRACQSIREKEFSSPEGRGFSASGHGSSSQAYLQFREQLFFTDDKVTELQEELARTEAQRIEGKITEEEAERIAARVQEKLAEMETVRADMLDGLRARRERIVQKLDYGLKRLDENAMNLSDEESKEARAQIETLKELFRDMPEDDGQLVVKLRRIDFSPEKAERFQAFRVPQGPMNPEWKSKRIQAEMEMLRGRMQMLERELTALESKEEGMFDWRMDVAPGQPTPPSPPLPPLPRRQ